MAGAKVTSRRPRIGYATKTETINERKPMKLNSHIHQTPVAALCVLALSPALMFADNTPKPSEKRGIIKSVDMDAHTIVVMERKNNSEQQFLWNDQTKFSERDKSASASDLKEGERVRLSYTAGGDTPILQSVHITPAKTEKHSGKNPSSARSNRAQA
jgi:hypothetical protein